MPAPVRLIVHARPLNALQPRAPAGEYLFLDAFFAHWRKDLRSSNASRRMAAIRDIRAGGIGEWMDVLGMSAARRAEAMAEWFALADAAEAELSEKHRQSA